MVTSTKQSKKPRVRQNPSRWVEFRKKANPKPENNAEWHDRTPAPNYPHPQRDINAIYNDIIRMKKDTIAETRTSYVLPHPEQHQSRPTGVNIDYCCQDFGKDTDKHLHTLKYRSALAEVYRQMRTR